jgi:dTDP-glucose pyrophosphorylase
MNWHDACVGTDATIRDALEALARTTLQICLVVDTDWRLVGTVTDGDVRRALLLNTDLETGIFNAMNSAPTTAAPDTDRDDLIATMTARHFHQIPLVDGDGVLVGLAVLDALLQAPQSRNNHVILMAGGLGKRLRPLTETAPKPMVDVGGKPILETSIERFVNQGYRRFYISVNYRSQQIIDHFGDGRRWGAEIRYLHEDEPLGTAGPLGLIDDRPEAPVIVMNGDVLTKVGFANLVSFHEQHGAAVTVAVRPYEVVVPFGVVVNDGPDVRAIHEKPVRSFNVNAGLYVIAPDVVARVAKNEPLDMPDLISNALSDREKVAAFPLNEYWADIGNQNDLAQAQADFDGVFGDDRRDGRHSD